MGHYTEELVSIWLQTFDARPYLYDKRSIRSKEKKQVNKTFKNKNTNKSITSCLYIPLI